MTLASADEPLILADGTRIDPRTGKVIRERERDPDAYVSVPSGSDAQKIVARTRRSVSELPLNSGNMNALSLCLLYTIWGLGDLDIAVVTSLSVEQVKRIKALPQYETLSRDIVKGIQEHDAKDIRQFFQQRARSAAECIAEIAENGEGKLAFRAAQDVLDRAGFRPADTVEHRHTMVDSLRIEHIIKREEPDLATIDTTYKEIT